MPRHIDLILGNTSLFWQLPPFDNFTPSLGILNTVTCVWDCFVQSKIIYLLAWMTRSHNYAVDRRCETKRIWRLILSQRNSLPYYRRHSDPVKFFLLATMEIFSYQKFKDFKEWWGSNNLSFVFFFCIDIHLFKYVLYVAWAKHLILLLGTVYWFRSLVLLFQFATFIMRNCNKKVQA